MATNIKENGSLISFLVRAASPTMTEVSIGVVSSMVHVKVRAPIAMRMETSMSDSLPGTSLLAMLLC